MNTTTHTYRRGQAILHLDTFLHIIDRIIEEDETTLKASLMDTDLIYTFEKSTIRPATEQESVVAYSKYSFFLRDRLYNELYTGDRVRIFGQEYLYQEKDKDGNHHVLDPKTDTVRVFDAETVLFLPYR